VLTIDTHEKKLISYLVDNKGDVEPDEPENYSLNKVPSQALNSLAPLLNKGSGEKPSDNGLYRLPLILMHSLLLWVAKYHELRISHPNGVILNAQPKHVIQASEAYPWGIVYDPERYLLMSWGDVPKVTLLGLRDLETGELLIAEQVAA
jgi:hypothetical protein